MSAELLLDGAKLELAEQLKAVEATCRQWRKVLTCQIEGIGRFEPSACRKAEQEFEAAVEDAQAIYSDTVEPRGLLVEAD